MPDRPYTVLSCSMSLDGYVDSATVQRLVLSNEADLDRVDALRASCDAILVGAATVRNDNPRLLIRSVRRRMERLSHGRTASPTKVTVTGRGELDPESHFFCAGEVDKLVYCPVAALDVTTARIGDRATVVPLGARVDMARLSTDLARRDVGRLMVEGGGTIHTQFLTQDLADELQLVVAPLFVGDSRARRFVGDGAFPWTVRRRARLAEVRPIGDVALLRYALSPRFDLAAGRA